MKPSISLEDGPDSKQLAIEAQGLMGHKPFGPNDWRELLGESLASEADQEVSSVFPWHPSTLSEPCPFTPGKRICETHVAYFGMPACGQEPFTVYSWMERYPELFEIDEPTANFHAVWRVACEPRWHLLPFPSSQHADVRFVMLDRRLDPPPIFSSYKVTSLVAEVTKLILYRQKYGGWPERYDGWVACGINWGHTPLSLELSLSVVNDKLSIKYDRNLPMGIFGNRSIALERLS
jgi:hypothetical protein